MAIVSPHKGATTETFIQAHIDYLKGLKFDYFGGYIPNTVTGKGSLLKTDYWSRIKQKFQHKLYFTDFTPFEYAVGQSFRKKRNHT